MAARDLPGAPFKIGQDVVIRQENIKPVTGQVWACKPTKSHGWYVSILEEVGGETFEIVAHEAIVFELPSRPDLR